VAEFNALVTDTHPLLFFAARSSRLSTRAASHFAACERQESMLYVPVVVIWEVCLLVQANKVRLQTSPQKFFSTLFSNPAYQPLDLTPTQVFLAQETRPNRDPFDALICAAARTLELPLLTRDSEITASGMQVVW
jgi:PIN domain nuclease of toxin-antitoxin system